MNIFELIYNYIANNITVISTIVLTISTVILAIFTMGLAKEAKKTRKFNEESHQPKLSVVIAPSERWINFLFIEIENIGKSPLYNLKLIKVKNNFVINSKHNKKIDDINCIKNINYLKPQQKISHFFASFIDEEQLLNKIFEIEFSYENKSGKLFKDRFGFDLNHFKGMVKFGGEPLEEIVQELRKINTTIKANAKGKERG